MVRPISFKNVKLIQKEYQWLWYKKQKKAGAKQSDVACDEIVIVNHDEVGFK